MLLIKVSPDDMRVFDVNPGHPGGLLGGQKCVFVGSNPSVLEILGKNPSFRHHGEKHDHKSMASYLLPRGGGGGAGVHTLLTNYTSRQRFIFQGLRPLMERAEERGWPVPMLVGVPEDLFALLHQGATGKEPVPDRPAPEAEDAVSSMLRRLDGVVVAPQVREKFLGNSPRAEIARKLIMVAAGNTHPVLLQGDSGTGKEIAARAVHNLRHGNARNFVPVNCGAIPESLFESELFGYVPGAFSNGLRGGKKGLWENANNGTLFLDEIADMPVGCQVKVLRAIQEGEIRPVGAVKNVPVNARIIAASSRDLAEMVGTGEFRLDLFYRLCGQVIRTVPLEAQPKEAVAEIILRLWAEISKDGSLLDNSALSALASRRWQGNYRQLKNVLRAVAMYSRGRRVSSANVREVLEYMGLDGVRAPEGRNTQSIAGTIHRIDSLRHLRRAAETIQMLQGALAPLKKRAGQPPADLEWTVGRHLADLSFLLREPLNFHSGAARRAAGDALEKTSEFLEIFTRAPRKAGEAYRTALLPALDAALETLAEEIDRL